MAGKAKKYLDKYKFLVKIPGFASAGFSKAGPLKGSVETIEHFEGGSLLADKSAGLAKFEPITLEHGATENADMYNFFMQALNAAADTGGADPSEYKKDLIIEEYYRNGQLANTWEVYGAWVQEFEAGDWDNSSNEKLIRKVVLEIDYFERG